MDAEQFVMMFPCYILARGVAADPVTGEVTIDENMQMVCPELGIDREKRPAIFTDEHLANEFLQLCPPTDGVGRVVFPRPKSLLTLLTALRPYYQHVVIDLNPKTRIGLSFAIPEFITEVEAWVDDPAD